MSNSPFVLEKQEYKRDLNILNNYLNDSASYLNKMTGKPLQECLEFVKSQIRPDGEFPFKDPDVYFLEREDNGDRVKKNVKLTKYIGDSIRDNELIAPTFTTYLSPAVKESLLVPFIDGNVLARGRAKKAAFKAKTEGEMVLYTIKFIEQTNKKLSNNALSGAHVSASTPLYNKTAHSTLTSNCRTTSGYGNANNEKILCGNRHYWSPDIVRNNIISIINNTDYILLDNALAAFNIRYPTVEETMECIIYSTTHYWRSIPEVESIRKLISNLSDIERAAFVYTGDLYHLMKFNEVVVRTFIEKLSKRIGTPHPDPETILSNAPDDNKHLAVQICEVDMKAELKPKMPTINIHNVIGTPAYAILASTTENIGNVLEEYRIFIKAFFVTKNVPASVAVFPDSIRRSAVTSDTDSTIFTVQDWVIWYNGKLGFDPICNAVAATMIFLSAQCIIHVLARMSGNFGIEEKRIHQIAMKNEYKFDIFTPTQVAKHYFALMGCQEGSLFAEYEKEIKGVHLKSSNAPKIIMAKAKVMMEFIMQSIIKGEDIEINAILKEVADIERDVIATIKKGSYEYFRRGSIKTPDSYTKSQEESPYVQYTLWEEVFAPKYGSSQKPPYSTIKVSTELNKPAAVKEWLEVMEDRDLAQRIELWMKRNDRKHLGSTFMLPEQCISSCGIPKEILESVGVRKIILDTTRVFYVILESLGIYMLNTKITRLISDTH